MVEPCRVSFQHGRLATRKAEEAACRRFEAANWLETMAGPLGLPPQPSEQEFISCLRNGLILCNTINKIRLGAVPKVVANPSIGTAWDIQQLSAYQYFENVRNFLVAVEELKLPSFEASDLERDTLDARSVAKIVDCILALKSYHEWRQCNGGDGLLKHAPIVPQSAGRMQSNTVSSSSVSCRHLDMLTTSEKQQPLKNENQKSEDAMDSLVRVLSKHMFNSKENSDQYLLKSWNQGGKDPIKLFIKIMSSSLEEPQLKSILEDLMLEGAMPINDPTTSRDHKHYKLCLGKSDCYHWDLLEAQENKLRELRTLLLNIRVEFTTLQTQLQNDFVQLGIQIQGISAAAHGYHQAVKENRHLYNILQELRGNIRVFCRIRPMFNEEAKCTIDYIGSDGSLMVIDPAKPQNAGKIFQFNKVFGPTATQDEVYRDTQDLIRSVMDGYNVCILAYGQTGSGKTHTMCGPLNRSNKDTGINYMALNDVFQISSIRKDVTYEICVQMVVIYNEQVHDLLQIFGSLTGLLIFNYKSTLEIRSCSSNGGLSLPDASMHLVQSSADVLDLMKLGEKNRAFFSTAMNHRSSRSHSVLTVHVHGKDILDSTTCSCLHLVDLAGSERMDKSETTGDRLNEAQHINKSLSCLEDVITALAQKNPHIPYGTSKLTQLLQNSLGGNAKMLMFAHVSPEADSYRETINTLKFAQRASTVELGAAHLNKESSEIRELKEQRDSLKMALAIKEDEKAMSSQKMKENAPNLDRLKQITGRNHPRPRRLSIENPTALKNGTVNNPDETKLLKSPKSGLKLPTDYAPIYNRRLSSDSSMREEKKQEFKTAVSQIYSKFSEEESLKENILWRQLEIQDSADAKASLDNEKCCSIVATEAFHQCSPGTCTSSCCSQLPKMESRSQMHLHQKTSDPAVKLDELSRSRIHVHQKTSDPAAKLDEIVTTSDEISFVTKSQTRSSNINASRRGSHMRKSPQGTGKFVHGSERRSIQYPSETSSKFAKSNSIDVKSPITADARSKRRQSFPNVQRNLNVPRRSSLGGISVNSSSSDTQSARTQSIQSSMKAKKRWL
ncbi:kinesin-like protein KIN-14A [Phoenix dactylifera]|uniref:Kinesin-like protein KIN-14A n=1 Tax=Phoenix dactylifera TaxID=42345 RepID=A0A8B8ZK06_PHODC|nr:kinesin-like protein KIN-14A [Phoenix dactylifera]